MAVIDLPDKVQFEVLDKMQLLRSGVALQSRYTGKRQVATFPFALWVFEAKLLPMEGLDAGQWRSFLAKLEGMKNTFRLPVPGASTPLSGFTGSISVLPGGGVAARSKLTSISATPNTLVLREGDYFNIGDELKIATEDITTNGSGAAILRFEPATRQAYPNGEVLKQVDPFIYLAAARNDSATWGVSRPVRHGIKLICVEAIE